MMFLDPHGDVLANPAYPTQIQPGRIALFEAFRPMVEAIGIQLSFVGTVSRAISNATAILAREAEVFFLLVFMAVLLEFSSVVWKLMIGR
jgi:hypothetical protein